MGGECIYDSDIGFVLCCHLTTFSSNECAREWRGRIKGTTPEFNNYYNNLSAEVKQVSQQAPKTAGINVADVMLELGEICGGSCKFSLWYTFLASISSVVQKAQLGKNAR